MGGSPLTKLASNGLKLASITGITMPSPLPNRLIMVKKPTLGLINDYQGDGPTGGAASPIKL